MNLITLDFETYYDQQYSLSKLTNEEYIRDPRFECIGFSIKTNNGKAVWFSGSKGELTRVLLQHELHKHAVLSHHAHFDMAILNWIFGIRPKVILDTLSMARAVHGASAGNSLAKLAERHGLGNKGDEVIKALGKHRLDFTAEELYKYGQYCCNDVDLTYALFLKLKPYISNNELKIIDQTVRMFTEPALRVDVPLLEEHLTKVKQRKSSLLESCGVDKKDLMSNEKFAGLLRGLGVEPPIKVSLTTGKEAYAFAKTDEGFKALLEHEDEHVQALAAARVGNKSTLEETRTQRFIDIGRRGLIPVPLNYCGAHTSRWSGTQNLNFQNLPSRGKGVNTIKRALMAPLGHVIIEADSAQIEARILAWFAGQQDLVDDFAAGRDIYKKMAAAIYKKSIEEIGKPSKERDIGKAVTLGCFSANTKVLTDSGWKRIVDVQTTDLVWDGIEWVNHLGVLNQGVKRVVKYLGVEATPDHQILTLNGWESWGKVITNHSLFQSAIRSANLPSLTGNRDLINSENPLGGTRLYDVPAAQRGSWTDTISLKAQQHVATNVRKSKVSPRNVVYSRLYARIKNYVNAFLTEYLAAYPAATTHRTTNTFITEGVGLGYTHYGYTTDALSYNTYSNWRGPKTRNESSTVSIMTVGMSQVISDLLHALKTCLTGELLVRCNGVLTNSKRKTSTYDIACAGPRNRFTILTEAGPIIVHNCGFGMGGERFQVELKKQNIVVERHESDEMINIYRQTYPLIPTLWEEAGYALQAIVRGQSYRLPNDCVQVVKGGLLLPNGLKIRYDNLRYERDARGKKQLVYDQGRKPTKIYGAKGVENAIQALASCIIREQALLISKRYKWALTVHDSLVVVVREEEKEEAMDYVVQCMRYVPDWAEGVPLDCEAGYAERYGDC